MPDFQVVEGGSEPRVVIISRRKRGWFVASLKEEVRCETHVQADKLARSKPEALLYRECECGCGGPAAQSLVHYRRGKVVCRLRRARARSWGGR